jgi:predicted dehydrogenase
VIDETLQNRSTAGRSTAELRGGRGLGLSKTRNQRHRVLHVAERTKATSREKSMKGEKMNEVRWGIIGCGDVTEVKSGPAFQRIPHSRVVAVMRRNGTRARDYAVRHAVPRWYDQAEALLTDPAVNAVYVATPPSSHEEYVVRAAAAGKPVLVEKPMGRTHEECLRMISACERARVPLFVAYYRRSLPAFLRVKALLDDGAIGELRCVNIRLLQSPSPADLHPENLPWRVQPEVGGGGYFVDLASHQFDFLDFLFGAVLSANGSAANRAGLYPAEDVVAADFAFVSGVCGAGLWCFDVPETAREDVIHIFGNKGVLSFSTFGKTPVVLTRGAERFEFADQYPDHIHEPFVASVVGALLRGSECPSTGVSAARTNWVLDQILRRYRQDFLPGNQLD